MDALSIIGLSRGNAAAERQLSVIGPSAERSAPNGVTKSRVHIMNPSSGELTLVSMKTACAMTSLSRTMICRLRGEGRFPQSVPLGDKRVAFVRQEVNRFIAERIAARGANDNVKSREAA